MSVEVNRSIGDRVFRSLLVVTGLITSLIDPVNSQNSTVNNIKGSIVEPDSAYAWLDRNDYQKVIDVYKKKFKDKSCSSIELKLYAVARLKAYQNLVVTRRMIDRLLGDNLRHAVMALEENVNINPDDLDGRFLMGVCYRIRDQYDDALRELTLVFDSDPSFESFAYSDVVSEMAIILTKQEKFAELQRLYEKAHARNPNAWSKIKLGISYGQMGRDAQMTHLFFKGLDSLKDDRQINWLLSECQLIATRQEQEAWIHLSSRDEKISFLKTFWKKRDPDPFDDVNEAMTQYFKRLSYARAMYSAPNEKDLDDRGKIYVRLGKPDLIFKGSSDMNIHENESWVYHNIEGGIHFDFVKAGVVYELRSLSDAMFSSQIIGEKRLSHLFQERSHLHPFYAELSARLERRNDGTVPHRIRQDFEKMQRFTNRQFFSFHNDSHPIFVNARYAIFKGNKRRTRFDFYYVIPFGQMQFRPDDETGQLHSQLETKLKILNAEDYQEIVSLEHRPELVIDSAGHSTRAFADEFRYELEPGSYVAAFQVRNEANRYNVYHYGFEVSEYSQDTVAISDLQLAFQITETNELDLYVKPHTSLRVIPNAAARITRDKPLFVYYEIYNLTLDSIGKCAYEVHYSIRSSKLPNLFQRLLGLFSEQKHSSVSSVTIKEGVAVTQRDYIGLDLKEVPAGTATLQIQVRDTHTDQIGYTSIDLEIVN